MKVQKVRNTTFWVLCAGCHKQKWGKAMGKDVCDTTLLNQNRNETFSKKRERTLIKRKRREECVCVCVRVCLCTQVTNLTSKSKPGQDGRCPNRHSRPNADGGPQEHSRRPGDFRKRLTRYHSEARSFARSPVITVVVFIRNKRSFFW